MITFFIFLAASWAIIVVFWQIILGNKEGKCAINAGGGRGPGRRVALAMAHHGAKVVVNGLVKELKGSIFGPGIIMDSR
jgi:hypothetical protein